MHLIARKHDSILSALSSMVEYEKTIVLIAHELYDKYKVYKPDIYYIGEFFIKSHYCFLVIDGTSTYIISICKNIKDFKIYDIHGLPKGKINYISVSKKDTAEISIVTDLAIETITRHSIEKRFKFIWN